MFELKKSVVNLTVVGSPNPQILTVDFLRDNQIIPENEEPFKQLLSQANPFTEFISTPLLVKLAFDHIEITADAVRILFVDRKVVDWDSTPIASIGRRYFDALRHTPVRLAGFNLTAVLTTDDATALQALQELCLPKNSRILEIIGQDTVSADAVLRYPYSADGERITLSIRQTAKNKDAFNINLNHEVDFTDWQAFGLYLERLGEVGQYFDSILDKISGEAV